MEQWCHKHELRDPRGICPNTRDCAGCYLHSVQGILSKYVYLTCVPTGSNVKQIYQVIAFDYDLSARRLMPFSGAFNEDVRAKMEMLKSRKLKPLCVT
ncbi:LOW QUALITY PROTEIN: hypothetical protein MAR_021414 [Mya arenaria]|uniref:Uncharacterized protein n=1 Tax=Mya arenaria TaxID=6604 RepID=A0ABY7E849_MYAAR|nr:LOW QUALITY PROTEIN: hypothetical protein MAR_021414 [Mya arenaria]